MTRLRTATLLVALTTSACASAPAPGGAVAPSAPQATAPRAEDRDWLGEKEFAAHLPAAAAARVEADPYVLFRAVNKPWARHVCQAFSDEMGNVPQVYLHGDAHLEQYSFTDREYGLDDFDDSARGPSVIDLVRFVGSLELAAQRRGWGADLNTAIDRFFRGYRTALADETFLPPMPSVVARLRPEVKRDPETFLEWADSLMRPVPPDALARASQGLALFAQFIATTRPDLSPEQFTLKKIGRLEMGVGSLLTPKYLARVEGPTPDPNDDVILEAKELSDLSGISCLDIPREGEVARVILGSEQVGRLHHSVLSVVPSTGLDGATSVRPWWIRAWNATYGELQLDDIRTPAELAEIAEDVGAQLGATNVRSRVPEFERAMRQRELEAVTRLEPRIRALAHDMSAQLAEAWGKIGQR